MNDETQNEDCDWEETDDEIEAERTVYHEAGHCVMAVLCGAFVERASVAPEEDGFHGIVDIHWPRNSPLSDQLAVALAGPVAEMIFRNEPYHPGLVPEWAHDWKQAWRIARMQTKTDRECLRRLETSVAQLYRTISSERYWAAISAVRDLLDAHDEIDHDAIAYEVRHWLS